MSESEGLYSVSDATNGVAVWVCLCTGLPVLEMQVLRIRTLYPTSADIQGRAEGHARSLS